MHTYLKINISALLVYTVIVSLSFGQTAQEWCARAHDALKVADALQCYAKAIEADPGYVYAYASRGRLKQQEGDLEGAIADFDKAIEISPQYGAAFHWRGLAKKALGDETGSRQDIEQGKHLLATVDHDLLFLDQQIEREPQNAKLLLDKAHHLRQRDKLQEAVVAFDQYLSKVGKPKNHLVYFERASTKKALGDLEGAEADYGNAIRDFPGISAAYQKRAAIREKRGNKAGAKEDRERIKELPSQIRAVKRRQHLAKLKALDEGSTDPQLLVQRAQLHLKNEDYAGVIADTDAVIAQDVAPELQQVLSLAYYLRSQAKAKLGDKDGQKADLREMKQLSRGQRGKNE